MQKGTHKMQLQSNCYIQGHFNANSAIIQRENNEEEWKKKSKAEPNVLSHKTTYTRIGCCKVLFQQLWKKLKTHLWLASSWVMWSFQTYGNKNFIAPQFRTYVKHSKKEKSKWNVTNQREEPLIWHGYSVLVWESAATFGFGISMSKSRSNLKAH